MDKSAEQIKAATPGIFWDELSNQISKLLPMASHPRVCERWRQFHSLLLAKNAVMNLTAITEEGPSILKHYLDSYVCWEEAVKFSGEAASILDFGCGGGFPSIPVLLALKNPPPAVLVDARAKKLEFVKQAALELSLNVQTVHGHWSKKDAQNFAKAQGRSELVTARAVGKTDELMELLAPVTKRILLLSRGPNLLPDEWDLAKARAGKLGFIRSKLVHREITFAHETIHRRLFLFARE